MAMLLDGLGSGWSAQLRQRQLSGPVRSPNSGSAGLRSDPFCTPSSNEIVTASVSPVPTVTVRYTAIQ